MSTSTKSCLGKDDYQALAALRLTLRRFLAFSNTALKARDVTAQQHQALLAIKASEEERLAVGELAGLLLVRPHSMVQLVDRLEDKGLVHRRSGGRDRRLVMLSLTTRADALLASLASIHLEELDLMGPLMIQALRTLRAGRRHDPPGPAVREPQSPQQHLE